MIQDVTSLYADLVKAAFFPSTPAVLTVPVKEKQVLWCSPMDGMGAWLPSCVRYVRYVNIRIHTLLLLIFAIFKKNRKIKDPRKKVSQKLTAQNLIPCYIIL